jgi:ribosomal protein S18 acetylase RimI-like enzyme
MPKKYQEIDCKIRSAKLQDRAAIAALSGKALGIYGNYRQYLPDWARIPEVVTLLAESDDKLLGFVMMAVFEGRTPPHARYVDILAIAVQPAWQGRGVGQRLLASALRMIEEQHEALAVKEVKLSVADTNRRGQAFFKSFGFEFTGETEGRYEGGQQALRMRRVVGE